MSDDRTHDTSPELEEALSAWREDAQRVARGVDIHGALADRIVAAAENRPPLAATNRAARLYAAAAVLLIGVGVTGTALTHREPIPPPTQLTRWTLDEELIDALARDPATEPRLGR